MPEVIYTVCVRQHTVFNVKQIVTETTSADAIVRKTNCTYYFSFKTYFDVQNIKRDEYSILNLFNLTNTNLLYVFTIF